MTGCDLSNLDMSLFLTDWSHILCKLLQRNIFLDLIINCSTMCGINSWLPKGIPKPHTLVHHHNQYDVLVTLLNVTLKQERGVHDDTQVPELRGGSRSWLLISREKVRWRVPFLFNCSWDLESCCPSSISELWRHKTTDRLIWLYNINNTFTSSIQAPLPNSTGTLKLRLPDSLAPAPFEGSGEWPWCNHEMGWREGCPIFIDVGVSFEGSLYPISNFRTRFYWFGAF